MKSNNFQYNDKRSKLKLAVKKMYMQVNKIKKY